MLFAKPSESPPQTNAFGKRPFPRFDGFARTLTETDTDDAMHLYL
jgi:hypothetical protein